MGLPPARLLLLFLDEMGRGGGTGLCRAPLIPGLCSLGAKSADRAPLAFLAVCSCPLSGSEPVGWRGAALKLG